MPPNLGGFFMVRSYYPSECHADYFDFERIEALKTAIEACGISTLSQSPMLGFHKQMDNRIKLLEEIPSTNNLFNNLIQRNQSAAFSSGKVRPNHETNINIIARRTGKDVNSHTVLDGIITTIMATIQRINIIGSREGSRNRRRLKANQTGKKFRVGIKSNISTNRNNLISGVDRCIHLNAMKKTTITSINRQTIKI